MYPRTCAKITKIREEIAKSEEVLEKRKIVKGLFSENHLEDDELKYWRTRNTMGACNNLSSLHMNDLPLPKGTYPPCASLTPGISSDEVEAVCDLSGQLYHAIYSHETIARLGIGRFLADMKKHIDDDESSSSRSKPFFIHYSGHDNTLGPLINSLMVC